MAQAPTIGFAVAACGAFGAAIASEPRENSLEMALRALATAPGGELESDPTAAELAAAYAAYDRIAITRASNPAALYDGLVSLLEPGPAPAGWLLDAIGARRGSERHESTRTRLDALRELGLQVELAGKKQLQQLMIAPALALPDGCAHLAAMARYTWGPSEDRPGVQAWEPTGSAFRAVIDASRFDNPGASQGVPPACELRIERVMPLAELVNAVPFDALGQPAATLEAAIAARATAELEPPRHAGQSTLIWRDAGLAPGGAGNTRLTAKIEAGTVAELTATASVVPEALGAIEARLTERLGAPSDRAGARRWSWRGTPVALAHADGRVTLTAGELPAIER